MSSVDTCVISIHVCHVSTYVCHVSTYVCHVTTYVSIYIFSLNTTTTCVTSVKMADTTPVTLPDVHCFMSTQSTTQPVAMSPPLHSFLTNTKFQIPPFPKYSLYWTDRAEILILAWPISTSPAHQPCWKWSCDCLSLSLGVGVNK